MSVSADFFIYVITTLITPGPNTIMSMRNGARCGFRKGLVFNIGIFTGFTMLMFLCLLFSRTIYQMLPQIRPVLMVAGAAYMLYQAWKCWNSKALTQRDSRRGSYLEGVLLQFVNPKAAVFGISVITNYIMRYSVLIEIQLLYCVGLAAISFTCVLLWSVFGSALGRLFTEHGRLINRIMACLLAYCAWKLLR